MFDIGWSELLIIAVVLIVVVGPKDLPRMLRQFGKTTTKLRAMGSDFRRQLDDALREADMEDVKDTLNAARSFNPVNEIRKHLSPIEEVGHDIRSGLDDVMKPMAKPEAASEAVSTEPLKNGAAALPGEEVVENTARSSAPRKKAAPKTKDTKTKAAARTRPASGGSRAKAASPARAARPTARSGAVTETAAIESSAAKSPMVKAETPGARVKSRSTGKTSAMKVTAVEVGAAPAATKALARKPAKAGPVGKEAGSGARAPKADTVTGLPDAKAKAKTPAKSAKADKKPVATKKTTGSAT